MAATDTDLGNGSIRRIDPLTGKARIISQADAARTALDRERNNENAMQGGAPAIAKGPPRVPTASAVSVQNSPASTSVAATKVSVRNPPAPTARFTPAAPLSIDPKTGVDTAATKPGDPLPTATQLQASAPQLPRPESLQNMQMASGPNISANDPRNPNTLPQGSAGYQRADGTYTVETADGKKQSFANEAAARSTFGKVAARPQAAKDATAFLNNRPAPAPAPAAPAPAEALSFAPASGSSGPTGRVRTANEGLPAAPVLPAPSFAQAQAETIPAAPQPAAPVPAPTPVNAPRVPEIRTGAGRLSDVGDAVTAFSKAANMLAAAAGVPDRNEASRIRSRERSSKEETAQIKRNTKTPQFKKAMQDGIDTTPVAPRVPLFNDEDPSAFPTLPGSAGTSRPRAILA